LLMVMSCFTTAAVSGLPASFLASLHVAARPIDFGSTRSAALLVRPGTPAGNSASKNFARDYWSAHCRSGSISRIAFRRSRGRHDPGTFQSRPSRLACRCSLCRHRERGTRTGDPGVA
jgi:hypothetical protein